MAYTVQQNTKFSILLGYVEKNYKMIVQHLEKPMSFQIDKQS